MTNQPVFNATAGKIVDPASASINDLALQASEARISCSDFVAKGSAVIAALPVDEQAAPFSALIRGIDRLYRQDALSTEKICGILEGVRDTIEDLRTVEPAMDRDARNILYGWTMRRDVNHKHSAPKV